ncbi:MAG TPA: cyclopropane-fatty-acyl-phospholipid synthase family protein [Acidimicrobiales bacterium]
MTTSDTADPGGRREGNAGPGGRREGNAGPGGRREGKPMAILLEPMVKAFVGPSPPITIRFWDGSTLGPDRAPATLTVRSPRALRRILYAPRELGAARAYVAGELDLDGDVYAALGLRDTMAARGQDNADKVGLGRRGWLDLLRAAGSSGAFGPPPPPPPEEARLRGRLHSKARDAAAISHHYDVSNDFYRLVLGETMTYSCAHFETPSASLEDAQRSKHDLVCQKLGLRPGARLLDVGCGWGTLAMHAAQHYGAQAVGITISERQAALAAQRVLDAGLGSKVEIRQQDYRDVDDGPYDAISSIGMFEHVGLSRLAEYLGDLYRLLRPEGRLLNHGISRPGPSGLARTSFINRYVFPDGELHEVGTVVSAAQAQHFEVRDVESLREHYARTLRKWVANLESGWDRAVGLVGASRARVWRLYMAGSALNFEAARTSIHQVLAVKGGPRGESGMPLTRAELLGLVPARNDAQASLS